MNLKKLMPVFAILWIVFSCNNEPFEENSSSEAQNYNVIIKNGRLSFPSKEIFAQVYKE